LSGAAWRAGDGNTTRAGGGRSVPFRSTFAQLFALDTTIAEIVFGLILAALAAAMALSWRRRRRGRPPAQRTEANRLEIGYALTLTAIAAFLVVASLTANAREFPDPKPVMRVEVTAYQWCWRFQYAGQPVTGTGQCQGGSLPTLVLPAGRPVELDVTSLDVVHAFWVPYLRFKMYAYPGHVNRFTVTLPHAGRWTGSCAQLCGLYHYEMDFYLQAVPPAAFNRFIQARNGAPSAVRG
jgi:cytochrome c oxidase subunit 2